MPIPLAFFSQHITPRLLHSRRLRLLALPAGQHGGIQGIYVPLQGCQVSSNGLQPAAQLRCLPCSKLRQVLSIGLQTRHRSMYARVGQATLGQLTWGAAA